MHYKDFDSIPKKVHSFQIQGHYQSFLPISVGLIHHTFLITTDTNTYILQKINHSIFSDVPILMNTIQSITKHLAHNKEYALRIPLIVPTHNGNLFLYDTDAYWRIYTYVGDTISSIPITEDICYKTAKAYASFSYCLSGFEMSHIIPSIPYFHSATKRMEALEKVVQKNAYHRVEKVKKELEILYQLSSLFQKIDNLIKINALPLRIMHNDTKINNILFDTVTNEPIAVVDLDTVMPGYIIYDVGDIIRTSCIDYPEDHTVLKDIRIDTKRIDFIKKGYREGWKNTLSSIEEECIDISGAYMALLMAVRFLTDYIDGNVYYKIHYEEHNLDRARNQLFLCEQMSFINT
ncbi:MAG: aminoglycoside phosphotransferase family protein [Chitinophagaceae bacterium]|nr:aminoglycoside phosphotransferase family protein [Chitinophagaceae bacterium]